jgi:hypothetical protein
MASSTSLENIANGDMLYHNLYHTIMVTSVGQEIIRGKHLFEGGFSAENGLNYLLALLCHDVGFVKGACKKDDLDLVTDCIERTRFPVPEGQSHQRTDDLAGLARAADLFGQLGDPEYLHKIPALFYEFEELGINQTMGCQSPGSLRRGYAHFFWGVRTSKVCRRWC